MNQELALRFRGNLKQVIAPCSNAREICPDILYRKERFWKHPSAICCVGRRSGWGLTISLTSSRIRSITTMSFAAKNTKQRLNPSSGCSPKKKADADILDSAVENRCPVGIASKIKYENLYRPHRFRFCWAKTIKQQKTTAL